MVVGVLQFEVIVHDAQSLKDKRRVVRSLKDRLHREHQVAVAEVGAHDVRTRAVLGLAAVGADGRRVANVLDAVTDKLNAMVDAELGACSREILHGRAADAPQDQDDAIADGLAEEMLARAEELES